jgi:cell division septation protein DedD
MYPITITLHNPAQLNAVLAALGTTPVAAQSVQHAAVDDTAGLEPQPAKKPKATPAPQPAAPAPSQPTAEVAVAAAPAKSTAAPAPQSSTAPAAAASSAVDYAQLSTAVLKLMKLDSGAAPAIAKGMGFDTFKQMKEAENAGEVFAKALGLVTAKIAELESV